MADSGNEGKERPAVPPPEQIKREFWEEMESDERASRAKIDRNQVYEAAGERDYLKMHADVRKADEGRFGEAQGWRWYFKPLSVLLGAGVPGLAILIGSFQTAEFLQAAGLSLTDADGNNWTGLLRLVLTIVGLVLVAVAAPAYRPDDWTQAGEDRLEQERQRYHDKKFGRRDD